MAISKAIACLGLLAGLLATESSTLGNEPSLAEIAAAQAASWQAIREFDMKYELRFKWVDQGKNIVEYAAPCRWSRQGKLERLRRWSRHWQEPRFIYEDRFLDGAAVREMSAAGPREEVEAKLRRPASLRSSLCQHDPRALAGQSPRSLEYLEIGHEQYVTFAELIARWKTSLKEKQIAENGDVLWRIRAEHPGDDDNAGSYIDVWVNANKGFLTQKALFCHAAGGTAVDTGRLVPTIETVQIARFRDSGAGVYFPEIIECHAGMPAGNARERDGVFLTFKATSLIVNAALPNDALDFRFPEGAIVEEILTHGRQGRIFLWGKDNRPQCEFASAEDYEKFKTTQEADELIEELVGFWISREGLAMTTVAGLLF